MTNLSALTRKEQVLARLRRNPGEWVDGTELANEEVGGSEGLRRLRELVAEGENIEMRSHPNPARDVKQYRLTAPPPRGPGAPSPRVCSRCGTRAEAWQQEKRTMVIEYVLIVCRACRRETIHRVGA